ncbi:MAG: hypothetical protein KAT35_02305, partial [Candidatus Aenigmarchaeota archaeon]|nr:hypothetical protein [Candidatus Aenigmarchaeota archaeon]
PQASAAQGETCLVYFTSTNCPNCATTDPIVLEQWTGENSNLVLIEYVFSGWTEYNAALLGAYSQEYSTMSAVPQVFVSHDKSVSGRIGIPGLDISSLGSNPCVMLDGETDFSGIDLNAIPGDPLKIWSGERLLVRTGQGDVPSEFLRELLFSDDLGGVLDNSGYEIRETEAEPVPIAGGHIDFEHAVEIGDSWILEFNDDAAIPVNSTNNSNVNVIEIPFFGKVDVTQVSIPLLTIMIGLSDGFNPCAFFILTFLLSAMIYAQSRKRILVVGGIFVFFSGFIYFLFMSLILNIYLYAAEITLVTMIAGLVAIGAGAINIKDFFFFKRGLSLTLPKKDKIRFSERVNSLIKNAKSFPALVAGTVILAATVNMYELLCTFGFPMVYTSVLSLHSLSAMEYYMYIAFYNVMYIIPLLIIVSVFAITMGSKSFSEEGVRNLKLVSGVIIFMLGLVLFTSPKLIENILVTFTIIGLSVLISIVIIIAKHFIRKSESQ